MPDPHEGIYQDLILDHFRHPRGQEDFEAGEGGVEKFNPTCGDRLLLRGKRVDDQIESLVFHAEACAICVASASMMCASVSGTTLSEAAQLMQHILNYFSSDDAPDLQSLGSPLVALESLKPFHMRSKCATLPWLALGEWLAL